MQKKEKKPWPVMLLITVVLSQYVSAHISGWIIEVGDFDLSKVDALFDYFILNPFDFRSFNPLVYLMVYGAGFAAYFHILFSRQPPRAEMKGQEHGSNDFMTDDEKLQFSAERSTPDFPYDRNVNNPGEYAKGVKKR